jgi:hypothetical protein
MDISATAGGVKMTPRLGLTGDNPRIMFLHFWGVGRTEDLAKTIKHQPPPAP